MEIIKTLNGHSGSIVNLVREDGFLYVHKKYNTQRNIERLRMLSGVVPVPVIVSVDRLADEFLMEYIPGIDMHNWLIHNDPEPLSNFINNAIKNFQENSIIKDYTQVYKDFLAKVDFSDLPFGANDLFNMLPTKLPSSKLYHGDMTLENIIYGKIGYFYFIDPVTTPFDSWVFDLAKLRQDLDCQWFIRKTEKTALLDNKLRMVKIAIVRKLYDNNEYFNDDYLLILMLLRVFLHCTKDSYEYSFIRQRILELWK